MRGTMSMATESSTTQSSSRWAQALTQLIETLLCSRGKCATASQWFVIPAPRGCMPCGCMVCFLRAPACVALPLDRINAFHCDMPADQSACNSFHRVLLLCMHPAALLHNSCTTRAPAPCLCTNTRQMLRENDPQLQSTSAQLKRMCIPVCRVADAATPCPSSHLGCVRTTPPQVTAMQLRHPVKAHMSHMPWPAEMLSSRPLQAHANFSPQLLIAVHLVPYSQPNAKCPPSVQMLRENDSQLRRASETLKRGELALDPVVHK